MKKVIFYIGLNDKETKVQEISTENARKIIENIFYKNTEGCTIFNGSGIYKHENGYKVKENTLIVECFEMRENEIYFICEYLKKALNQESIAVNIQEINCLFI